MLDFNNILGEFVRIAQESVGTQLSQTGPVGNQEPAVIKARQGGAKPDYPYIQLDLLNTSKVSGWELQTGVVEVNGEDVPFIDTNYKLLMQYTVYGGNANSIAHELEAYFRLNRVLGDIRNNTTGSLEQTFSVSSLPERLSTENLEVASFNFSFTITDRYAVNDGTGVFDRVRLDGELARNEDDLSPLPLDIDVGPV